MQAVSAIKQSIASIWLLASCASMRANDLYVSPDGNPSGSGSRAKPYDLTTALSGTVGRAGDTFWLRNGVHRIGHVDTQIHGSARQPITFREVPGEHAQVVGSFTVWGEAAYLIFRDFELYSGDTRRVSGQRKAGFTPTDVPETIGIQAYAPNISFINLIVHDSVRSGFYTSAQATNSLIYGCIVYNTGWVSPDNAEGHSFYLQGGGEISDNICFNSTGANFHLYANSSGCALQNLTVAGNVAFGAGTLQGVRSSRDWIVGVDSPSVMADKIVLKDNMGYLTTNSTTLTQVQIGREKDNGSVLLTDNYWPQGLVLNNWKHAIVSGNLVAPQNSDCVVELHENLASVSATWNKNIYVCPSPKNCFQINSKSYSFSEWKDATGYDSASSVVAGQLTGTKVFVRRNRFEPGRANIVIYNWDKLSKIAVDVCSVVSRGAAYEVRNAQDFFSRPVLSGRFDGKPLELPMSGLTVAKPMAALKTPSPTGPTFNVFVLLSNKNQ
jgi:hypothetical protein